MLDEIKQPIQTHFQRFLRLFETPFAEADTALLSTILSHIHSRVGKQLRPIFTLLAAGVSGTICDNTLRVAVAYETLHTASLVHDDVVDEAATRRGAASANALFGNKEAVLAGDYLLARAISLISETESPRLMHELCHLSKTLSEGEFLQLQHAYTVPTAEQVIEIMRRKTAVLFEVSARSAAVTAGATEAHIAALSAFAEAMGICFQIRDDIFDYTPGASIGKPTLNDIREGKVTLPLRHALAAEPADVAAEILAEARAGRFTDSFFARIMNLIDLHDGIAYARGVMAEYRDRALSALAELPDCECRKSLAMMLDFVIDRNR